ncbi:site-specific recombinase XerD [Pseudonocardia hierapolitana]|uniref:Site-specific recombinase XerD n=1 Tax=Pseudonocardia hierapolitana TaxID=1128676 RepID=A0A561T434_9PSEU|nr:tyrosine-type recombinase/integrase [Pseudonocardia hierapolitana]TWF81877.1 site-specific recombinase XerD [Pseudonocardia hierapolitana]
MSGRNINGEGSVYQRKDGRWVAAAYVPVVGGSVRRQALYAKTRAEASKKLRELLDRAEKHIPVAPTSLTVAGYLDEWLIHVRQHVRATTWEAYERNVRLYLIPRIGRKKLTRLTVRDVRLMIDALRAEGIGARTIQYVHATLRAALEHAYREELVSRNVAKLVRVERPKPAPKKPLTIEEARKLLDGTTDDRLHALWVLLLMLGLRRSEACGLRWEHIDFVARTLQIVQTVQRVDGKLRELPTKTRRSNRTVPLPPRVLFALARHHRHLQERYGAPGRPWPPEGYVFGTRHGTPLDPRNLTRMWSELCADHGIRVVPLHGLRHTCVSLLLALGVHPRIVMEIVGHSAMEMTMNVYGHVNLEAQRSALDHLDEQLS